jgi:hypothetical protein
MYPKRVGVISSEALSHVYVFITFYLGINLNLTIKNYVKN